MSSEFVTKGLNLLRCSFGNIAILDVTTACFCRCKCCDRWKMKPKEMDFEKFVKYFPKLEKKNIQIYDITGGEPTLYPHLIDLITFLKKKGKFVYLTTNGMNINEDFVKRIVDYVDIIGVSVDSYSSKIIKRYKGVGEGIKRLKKTFKLLKKYEISNRAICLIERHNYQDIGKLLKFVNHDLGTSFGVCHPSVSEFYSTKRNKITIGKKELISTYRKIIKLKHEGAKIITSKVYLEDTIRYLEGNSRIHPCLAGKNIFYIDPQLRIHPCFNKKRICSIEKLDKTKTVDFSKCEDCAIQCFREPSIVYTFKGKLELLPDLLGIFSTTISY